MRFFSGRLVLGLFLLFLGLAIILRLFGVDISARQVWSFWPVIPLLLGINWMVLSFRSAGAGDGGRRIIFSWGRFVTGLIAAAIGLVYLAPKLGPRFEFLANLDMKVFWSILLAAALILFGLSLIRGRAASGGNAGRFAFMGGVTVGGSTPWKLESGSYFAFMGGIDIDLTTAEIPGGETVLDLTAFMGGIEVKIPPDLAVIYEGSAILGGVAFKDQEEGGIIAGRKIEHNVGENTGQLLRIQARAIMGGIEIKDKA